MKTVARGERPAPADAAQPSAEPAAIFDPDMPAVSSLVRPSPVYVKIEDIPAVVAEWRRKRGLPDSTPPEGLNEFGRLAWTLRRIGNEIERQGKLLAALRARMRR